MENADNNNVTQSSFFCCFFNAQHAPQSCVRLCVQKSAGYMFTVGNFRRVHMYVLWLKKKKDSEFFYWSADCCPPDLFPSLDSSVLHQVKL